MKENIGCIVGVVCFVIIVWAFATELGLFNSEPSPRPVELHENWDGSFTGSDHNKGRKCSRIVGAGGAYCSCSGCNPGHWDAFTCSNCGHKCDEHTR